MYDYKFDVDEELILESDEVIWVSQDLQIDYLVLTNKKLYCMYESYNKKTKSTTIETDEFLLSDIVKIKGQPVVKQKRHEGDLCLQVQFKKGIEFFHFFDSPKEVTPIWISAICEAIEEKTPLVKKEKSANETTKILQTDTLDSSDSTKRNEDIQADALIESKEPSANIISSPEISIHRIDEGTKREGNQYRYCVNCGTEIKEGYDFCPECGLSLLNEMSGNNTSSDYEFATDKFKICRFCGERMPDDSFYCLSCGNSFESQEVDFEEIKNKVNCNMEPKKRKIDTSVGVWKNKWVALILCVFFGGFGAHRFYEGKRITGFIYLFTLGLFGIGWFIDIILLATKTNPYRVK